MDARSRKALQPIYANLLPGFTGEVYDDFINYEVNKHTLRVVRFVGPSRCVVVFHYETLPTGWGRTPKGALSFLHEDGGPVPFDSAAVYTAGQSWDRMVGEWLVQNGAQQFTGTNWVGRIAAALVTLLPAWKSYHKLENA